MASVLIIGSGGREHALAWKLSLSSNVSEIIVTPGNGGTEHTTLNVNEVIDIKGHSRSKIRNDSSVPLSNFSDLAVWCQQSEIDLVVVGPEVPLADGICNALIKNGIKCFGPTCEAAAIEASKEFSKEFMIKNNIPTARFKAFRSAASAIEHIKNAEYPALVVKASGLASGKGVIVCDSKEEACDAAREILENNLFGPSGDVLVVEERLYGEEFSVLCFSDGNAIAVMPPTQDHKQVYEGDQGPNTGGMGAYGPCSQIDTKCLSYLKTAVLQKAIDGMRDIGRDFTGVLYAGVMITKNGPKVLEFNCRFGDPECQVLMSLLESDLYEILHQCCSRNLSPKSIKWKQNATSVCIVMASKGYPGSYEKNKPIAGISNVNATPSVSVFEAGTTCNADGIKVTNGGRVLSVCATACTLELASELAVTNVKKIRFDGGFFRKDIGWKGLKHNREISLTYASSGVSIKNGDAFVQSISSLAKSTSRKGCISDLGGFGALFDLASAGYADPVLVSGTDGVGTKLLLAQECNQHTTIGQDLVAMCVNDILTHNAEPLFFLDYFSCGKLKSKIARDVLEGIANGCKLAGCGLIGGETAEMPGMYSNNHYDLAGFAVGAYDKKLHTALPRMENMSSGDIVIGIASSGLHSNGFSLIREVVKRANCNLNDICPFEKNKKLIDYLLTPTAIYVDCLLPILRSSASVKGVAHITGGGLPGNLSRVLRDGLCAVLDAQLWHIPSVFGWLSKTGSVADREMLHTFNCGIGMCLIVEKKDQTAILNKCKKSLSLVGLHSSVIGYLENCNAGNEKVTVNNFAQELKCSWEPQEVEVDRCLPAIDKCNKPTVAVFISGTGTNLQALIDHQNSAAYQISLVISNKADAKGLLIASSANIPHVVIDHRNYENREAYDHAIHEVLMSRRVHLVCLAGFMRLLSSWFTHLWKGRIINIHPSLLPSFKGMDAHEKVLKSGVRITGCTAHFVTEKMDEGAIIAQTAVKVHRDDSVTTLSERVKLAEHTTYPEALDLVASGDVYFDADSNRVFWNN